MQPTSEARVGEGTEVQPDVILTRRDDVDPDALRVPPLLAIEVLSPSTRSIDLGAKLDAYARAGLDDYWVVDPIALSLTVFERRGDELVRVAHVEGADAYDATRPVALRVVPAELPCSASPSTIRLTPSAKRFTIVLPMACVFTAETLRQQHALSCFGAYVCPPGFLDRETKPERREAANSGMPVVRW